MKGRMEPGRFSQRTEPVENASNEKKHEIYTVHFGFREQPFNITADPRFFYPNPGHEEAYKSLLYGIHERKGCITLIGEAGTGKTTLLHKVRKNLGPTVHTAYFFNTTLTFDELLDFVCNAFHLPVKGGRRLEKIQGLHKFLLTRLQEGGTGVLIVDEAQNLDTDVLENLRLLSNLEAGSEKLLQIILVGQPELEKKLEQPELRQLKQRIAIRAQLNRLRAQDIAPLIHHRLSVAGCKRHDLFTPEALQRIAMYSGGIPRLINTICDNAFLAAHEAGQQTISATMVEKVAQKFRLRVIWPCPQEMEKETEAAAATPLAATLLANRLDQESQAWMTVARRSWWKRFMWAGAVLVCLFLLSGGDPSTILWRHRKNAPHLNKKRIPSASVKQRTDKPPEQESELTPQVPPSSTPLPQHLESSTEEPLRVSSFSPTDFQAVERQGQSVTITRGDTIAKIVFKMYGDYSALAFGLIKEFNPHLDDLDRVAVGEQVWLPFLTREILLRPQEDGSYHLIIGVFSSPGEAERVAREARRQGYTVTISQQRVSRTRLLRRVELEKLADLAAIDRAWSFIAKGQM